MAAVADEHDGAGDAGRDERVQALLEGRGPHGGHDRSGRGRGQHGRLPERCRRGTRRASPGAAPDGSRFPGGRQGGFLAGSRTHLKPALRKAGLPACRPLAGSLSLEA